MNPTSKRHPITDIATKCILLIKSMSHVALTNVSCRPRERVSKRSHVAHMNEGHRTYECALLPLQMLESSNCMSHATQINESWHTYECVLTRKRITHMKKHTNEWVTSHIWINDWMNESCHTYECALLTLQMLEYSNRMSHDTWH